MSINLNPSTTILEQIHRGDCGDRNERVKSPGEEIPRERGSEQTHAESRSGRFVPCVVTCSRSGRVSFSGCTETERFHHRLKTPRYPLTTVQVESFRGRDDVVPFPWFAISRSVYRDGSGWRFRRKLMEWSTPLVNLSSSNERG